LDVQLRRSGGRTANPIEMSRHRSSPFPTLTIQHPEIEAILDPPDVQ
jgi:hypothetical protein